MADDVTWIAFLRAINLGARRKFPRADLAAAVERAGGRDVAAYLNTGNLRLRHAVTDRREVEAVLERTFAADRGFDVPTVCFTAAEIAEIAAQAAALGGVGREAGRGQHVAFLKEAPTPEQVAALEEVPAPGERAVVRGRAVHLLLGDRYRHARLNNQRVERHCGVATTRTANVLATVAERWGAGAG